jgi:carbon starvation protein
LTNKYVATAVAVGLGGLVAMLPASEKMGPGSGGMILWPLFGATNQLLAGLAFMVTVFYLWRRNKPIWFAAAPMVVMLIMPAWAMLWQMFNTEVNLNGEVQGWFWSGKYLLFGFGVTILLLQAWMIIEGALMWPKVKGVLEKSLPPLKSTA